MVKIPDRDAVVLVDTEGTPYAVAGGGTSTTDDAAFTPGTSSVTPAGHLFDDVAPDSVDEGDVGVGRMSANRNQYVTIRDSAGNERGLAVDANGAIAVTGAGAGTQYTEDAASAADPVGTVPMLVRRDTPSATEVSAENDNIAAKGSSAGAQYVELLSGIAKIGGDAANGLDVDVTRLPALVAGSANIGDVDVLTVPAPLSTTGGGTEATALRVTLASDSTGLVSVDDNGGSLTVDNAQLSVVGSGTEAAAMRVTIATDSTGVLSVDDNGGSLTIDNAQLSVVGGGTEAAAMRVTIASDSTGVLSIDDNGGSLTVDGTVTANLAAGTNTNEMVGDVAHDSPIGGNPVRIGGRALTADYTAVATGDTADLITTILGKQVVKLDAIPDLTWSYAAAAGGLVNTTEVTAKAAGAAGVRNYVKSCQVINSHATISTEVVIRDGTAGTVLHRGWAQAAGGGYAMTFDPPLRGTAATLISIGEITATGTAGVLVNLQGYSGAE